MAVRLPFLQRRSLIGGLGDLGTARVSFDEAI